MDGLSGDTPAPSPPHWGWMLATAAGLVLIVAILGVGHAIPLRLTGELIGLALLVCTAWGMTTSLHYHRTLSAAFALTAEGLNRTIDGAPIGLALVGLDGRWLRVNPALSSMIGYSAEHLLGRTFQDITHPDDLATDLRQLEETIRGERSGYVMEKRYFHRDGRIVPVELHVSLVRDAAGIPVHFVSQIVDLSGRIAIERALRREEAAFAALVEEADDIIIRYDAGHRIRYANPATRYGSGIDPKSMVGRRVEELGIDPALAERWNAALARVLSTSQAESLEYTFPHPDGGPREWLVRFAPERGTDGSPIGVFAVSRDITALRSAADALRRRDAEFVALVENAEELIARYDLAGRYRYANPAALRFIDRSLGEILGRRPVDLGIVPEAVAKGWEARNGQAARERRSVRQVVTMDGPDGARTYESSAIPEYDANGRATSVLVISRDISERRALELERELLLEQLTASQAASQAAIHSLEGLLPTCAWCHRVREQDGSWERMETYLKRHANTEFTHGVCPDCAAPMLTED